MKVPIRPFPKCFMSVSFLFSKNLSHKPVIPNVFCTRDKFCGRQFFYGAGVGKMVSGLFKCITCISNLMLSLICQEVPDFGPEDEDPGIKKS